MEHTQISPGMRRFIPTQTDSLLMAQIISASLLLSAMSSRTEAFSRSPPTRCLCGLTKSTVSYRCSDRGHFRQDFEMRTRAPNTVIGCTNKFFFGSQTGRECKGEFRPGTIQGLFSGWKLP